MIPPELYFQAKNITSNYEFVKNEMMNQSLEKCKDELFTYLDGLKARTYSIERYILGGLLLRGRLPKSVISRVEQICLNNQIPITIKTENQ